MDKKTLVIVGVLVVGAAATILIEKKGSVRHEASVGTSLFPKADAVKVKEIVINDGTKELTVRKTESGTWLLPASEQFPAQADKVVKLFEALEEAKIVRHVASKKDEWARLDLEKGRSILLKGDQYEAKFLLGKNRDSGGQYVAKGSGEDAFLIDKALATEANSESWEYKTLVKVKPEDVKAVALKTKEGETLQFSREKKEDELKLAGLAAKEKQKDAEVGRLKTMFSNVIFNKKDKRSDAYNTALAMAPEVTVKSFGGFDYAIKVVEIETIKKPEPTPPGAKPEDKDKAKGPETERFYYLHVTSTDPSLKGLEPLMAQWQFEVSEYVANNFRKKRSDFVEISGS